MVLMAKAASMIFWKYLIYFMSGEEGSLLFPTFRWWNLLIILMVHQVLLIEIKLIQAILGQWRNYLAIKILVLRHLFILMVHNGHGGVDQSYWIITMEY